MSEEEKPTYEMLEKNVAELSEELAEAQQAIDAFLVVMIYCSKHASTSGM